MQNLWKQKNFHGLFNVIKNTLNVIAMDIKEKILVIKLIVYLI